MTRTLLGLLGWLAAAAAAVTAGVFAVGAIGSGISSGSTSPLSNQAVASALAQTTAPTTVPSSRPSAARSSADSAAPSRSSMPSRRAHTRVLSLRAGTVVAKCGNGLVTLVSVSPDQGYGTDDIHRGPDRVASLKFTNNDVELKIEIACQRGIPTARTETRDDD